MVVVVPVPFTDVPGIRVNTQFPEDGKPLRITLPVIKLQDGCVILSTIGAAGVSGGVLMVIPAVAGEEQPSELVTVKL